MAPMRMRLFAVYDCQAREAVRSMLWSSLSHKRIPLRPRVVERIGSHDGFDDASA